MDEKEQKANGTCLTREMHENKAIFALLTCLFVRTVMSNVC